jgi:tetratricopeptide (TPR) repeat protein
MTARTARLELLSGNSLLTAGQTSLNLQARCTPNRSRRRACRFGHCNAPQLAPVRLPLRCKDRLAAGGIGEPSNEIVGGAQKDGHSPGGRHDVDQVANAAPLVMVSIHGSRSTALACLHCISERSPEKDMYKLAQVVLLFAATTPAFADPAEDCNKKSGDAAIAGCTEVIRQNPRNADAYVNRCNEYWEKGESDLAIADCSQAIRLDSTYAPAYNNRGLAYQAKGESDRALRDYTKAIALDPKLVLPYVNRCNVYHDKKELDRAMRDCDKAIQLETKYAPAYNSRGNVYRAKGVYERAIADYTRAIELDPEDAASYDGRAKAYLSEGNAAQGLSDANRLLELHPDDAYALNTRGSIYAALGRREDAIADFKRALEKIPTLQSSKDALLRLGVP